MGYPKSSKTLDHFSIETHDMGNPSSEKKTYIHIYIYDYIYIYILWFLFHASWLYIIYMYMYFIYYIIYINHPFWGTPIYGNPMQATPEGSRFGPRRKTHGDGSPNTAPATLQFFRIMMLKIMMMMKMMKMMMMIIIMMMMMIYTV